MARPTLPETSWFSKARLAQRPKFQDNLKLNPKKHEKDALKLQSSTWWLKPKNRHRSGQDIQSSR
ncbi:hypothetical protein 20 [Diadegma semiclausum ichnovirus]|nr:hypothetical protein 20 [Diadegma semiclausum ichnovirus]